MDNVYYVYLWTRLDTNEVFYVGKGHGNRYKDMSMRNKYFLNIVNKVGMDHIQIDIIEENLSEEEAFAKEQHYIAHYKKISSCLTNMTKGGEGSSDWFEHLTEEEKEIHRERSKSFLGKHHTQETKEKIRKSHIGKSHHMSKEGHDKLSELAKHRPSYWKGKHLSEDIKKKMSETRKQRFGPPKKVYDPSKRVLPKPVDVYNANGKLVLSFLSRADCVKYFQNASPKLSEAYIKKLLRGDGYISSNKMKNNPYFGYHFVYKHTTSRSTIETVSSSTFGESNGVEYQIGEIPIREAQSIQSIC